MFTIAFIVSAMLAAAAPGTVPPSVALVLLQREIAEQSREDVLCIEVDEVDPSNELLESLRVVGRTIVPASECKRAIGAVEGTVHIKSKRQARILGVSKFIQFSPSSGEAEVSAYYHGKWATYRTYELLLVDGQWKVGALKRREEA